MRFTQVIVFAATLWAALVLAPVAAAQDNGAPAGDAAGSVATDDAASAPATAAADDATRSAARDLAKEGVELLKAGNYEQARQRLHRAYELYPVPTVALFEGQALEELGRLVEAAERYEAAKLFELPADAHSALRSAVIRAGEQLERLRPLIPTITVEVPGADPRDSALEVRLDGKALNNAMLGVRRPVNPGEHRVVALVRGKVQRESTLSIGKGQHERVVLAVALLKDPAETAPPPPQDPGVPASPDADAGTAPVTSTGPNPQQTIGWISLGVGAAGLVTGVVAGIIMMGKDSVLEENCDPECPRAYEDDLATFETSRTVSMIGYGVGVVGLGVGAVLLLTAPDQTTPEGTAGISPWLGPQQLGLRGTF